MDFTWPLALLGLLVLPALVAGYLLVQRRRNQYAVRFSNLALLREVATAFPGRRRHVPAALYLLATGMMVVAMARPNLVIPVPVKQTNIMLAIDVSRSMEATDIRPSRIDAAKQAAIAFVNSLPREARVGLVAFSTSASLALPLTDDRTSAVSAIKGLTTDSATAIGDAILVSLGVPPRERPPGSLGLGPRRALPRATPTPGPDGPIISAVVLLTDGMSNRGVPPLEAALEAKGRGVKVYTVGVGTERGGTVEFEGQRLRVGIEERTLQEIAGMTDAEYFFASDADQLKAIYKNLSATLAWEYQHTEVTALFTAAAMLVSLLGAGLSLWWFNRLP